MSKIIKYVYLTVLLLATIGCEYKEEIEGITSGKGDVFITLSVKDNIMTRAADLSFESKVTHLDLFFIKDQTTDIAFKEHLNITDGTIKFNIHGLKVSQLENYDWDVYAVANSEITDFSTVETLADLQELVEETRYVYITGTDFKTAETDTYIAPRTFLMTGKTTIASTSIADGSDLDIPVSLVRSVAKVTVNFNLVADDDEHGITANFHSFGRPLDVIDYNNIELDGSYIYSYEHASYYLRNLPYKTYLFNNARLDQANKNISESKRKTNPITNAGYMHNNNNNNSISVIVYVYSCAWGAGGTNVFNDSPFLIVNLPAVEKISKIVDAQNVTVGQYLDRNYYQIPLRTYAGTEVSLLPNNHYVINAAINAPGGLTDMEPVPLVPVYMSVYPWNEKEINVGGEQNKAKYLNLSTSSVKMHNVSTVIDAVKFASSSRITDIELTEAYFIDKMGLKKSILDTLKSQYRPNATYTPDVLNGYIETIESYIPTNNAIRYMTFTITNADNLKKTFTVEQYPLIYITNQLGWYSFRTDVLNNVGVITDYEHHSSNNKTKTSDERFVFRVSKNFNSNTGASEIYTYNASSILFWDRPDSYGWYTNQLVGGSTTLSLNNARMYNIVFTTTNTNYKLGKPQMEKMTITNDAGKKQDVYATVCSADNENLISPSFIVASQLGTLDSFGEFSEDNYLKAVIHCANYVETYTNAAGETIKLSGWRLPTKAELQIIKDHQTGSDAMDELLNGRHYFCASTQKYMQDVYPVTSLLWWSNDGYWTRCVRDAYDSDVPVK